MSQKSQNIIEFVNGPFDGHLEILSTRAAELPETLVCYISENVFRLMNGETQRSRYSITSVAFYRRARRSTGWVYSFAGAVAPDQIHIAP